MGRLWILLAALLVLLAVASALLTVQPDPARCTLERVRSARGWSFEELVNLTDARVLVRGNVSVLTRELFTSVVVLKGVGAENYLVYSNASHSMVNFQGVWLAREGGWTVEDTFLYKVLSLALSSERRSSRRQGGVVEVTFEGECRELCQRIFSELRSIASSAAPSPARYSGRLRASGCAPESIVVDFLSNGSALRVSYTVSAFDVEVSARPARG
uniref:Uncharacterized protein n=1 Tax=Thermofilum pendens TaxID=2269 RepID=A0A7C3WPI4_THEPE